MTNEIIELLEQSEYGIIAINEPNIFLDVCLPAEGCASDVAIWYDDKMQSNIHLQSRLSERRKHTKSSSCQSKSSTSLFCDI